MQEIFLKTIGLKKNISFFMLVPTAYDSIRQYNKIDFDNGKTEFCNGTILLHICAHFENSQSIGLI